MSPTAETLDSLLDQAQSLLEEGHHRRAIHCYRRAQTLAPFRQDIRALLAEAIDALLLNSSGALDADFRPGDFSETRLSGTQRGRRRHRRGPGLLFGALLTLMIAGLVGAVAMFMHFSRQAREGDGALGLAPISEGAPILPPLSERRSEPDEITDSPEALIAEARLHIANDSFDDAMTLLEEARAIGAETAELAPVMAEVHLQRGRAFYSQGRFNRALAECERAAELDATNAEIFYSMGWCHHSLATRARTARDEDEAISHFEEARRAFEQSVEADALLAKSHRGLARTHLQLGNREAAFAAWQETILAEPAGRDAELARNALRSHGMPLPEM